MTKQCENAFLTGRLMYGPKGGEYIFITPKDKTKKKYKKYCKISESKKTNLITKVTKGYRPSH